MKQAARKRLSMKRKAAAICCLAGCQGRVTPRSVWQAARSPAHPLHNEFEWDTKKARKRNGTGPPPASSARSNLVVEYEDARVVVPFYLSDPRALTSTYIPTIRAAKNAKLKTSILREEVDRIVGGINRGMKIAGGFRLGLIIRAHARRCAADRGRTRCLRWRQGAGLGVARPGEA